MTHTPYLTALMLVAITIIGNACVSAGSQPARTGHFFADTFLSTINVECSRWVSDTACLDFMLAFQWPLSVPSSPPLGFTFSHYLTVSPRSFLMFADFPGAGRGHLLDQAEPALG